MRTKSPEKRSRQKPARQQAYRVETERNPETTPQYFQISVNVLEARKLIWMNPHSANSYVIVVLGKKKHRTTIRRNMEEPYYREYFMFELYVSIRDLQRTSIWLAVMEPRCCAPPRLMGEASIDLGAIWSQPSKWHPNLLITVYSCVFIEIAQFLLDSTGFFKHEPP
ncbi:otoferlin-like [Trichoplusia ni]|uniref:Otoferlin-like n=1 Tax=Trichoplusia ni TaxID=7111 RepID=A0A7E5VIH1_TRINI|nr:otoferlin-like [Trichoplusia ni]